VITDLEKTRFTATGWRWPLAVAGACRRLCTRAHRPVLAQPMLDQAGSVSGDPNMERRLRVQNILDRWATQHDPMAMPEAEADEASRRSTNPDALMELVLRFTTEAGPRTITASGVPLKVASAITQEMLRAGHYAEYSDQRPRTATALWARGQNKERAAKPRSLLKLAATRP
jgi:hypothetical protein